MQNKCMQNKCICILLEHSFLLEHSVVLTTTFTDIQYTKYIIIDLPVWNTWGLFWKYRQGTMCGRSPGTLPCPQCQKSGISCHGFGRVPRCQLAASPCLRSSWYEETVMVNANLSKIRLAQSRGTKRVNNHMYMSYTCMNHHMLKQTKLIVPRKALKTVLILELNLCMFPLLTCANKKLNSIVNLVLLLLC